MTTKERPILFSGPMVRAILAGRKTQTRLEVKAINHDCFEAFTAADPSGFWGFDANNNPVLCVHSPYGEAGDRLWVRETFHEVIDDETHEFIRYGYRADKDWDGAVWSPSIYMPRKASRITLEVVDVRIERLNDISREDAIAEGIEPSGHERNAWKDYLDQAQGLVNPINSFCSLWRMINGPGSWTENPWVWVVEFERTTHK